MTGNERLNKGGYVLKQAANTWITVYMLNVSARPNLK